ncbi:MAG: tannase/feruloyl esterase family alpha/beta hydrolase [Bryobacterales bacterium]|nr:tannase/feruloyl esterase family alpha/beta hydrolase [Bryobacterales bacterium]
MKLAAGLWMAAAACAATPCEELGRVAAQPNTVVQRAELVTAGEFTPPGAKTPIRNLPPFCRVSGSLRPSADSDIRFEVWLPAAPGAWNGKFQGIGNGGFAGAIAWGGLAGAVTRGYATASTDTGHEAGGTDARWAMDHPEKVIDFGHRAIHETAVKGKAFTTAFYGQAPKYSYFSSCSNGGRQALMEAQRYPEDYDGIIAGAPANWWTHLMTLALWEMKATLADPAAYIPAAKLKAIQAAMLAACDAADQVKDGVINEPLKCRAPLETLRCQAAENDACLTAPQLEALRKIQMGLHSGQGKRLFPAISPGGEAEPGGWGAWITGPAPEQSAMYLFGTNFFKYVVHEDANWDFRKADIDKELALAVKKTAHILDANNPDVRPFLKRGGKLILYHGWCDAAIPAENTIDYYRNAVRKVGAKSAASGLRLFMAPGVQHCGAGAGPNAFGQGGPSANTDAGRDMNAALERWVEQDTAPEQIIATKYRINGNGASGVERTRPLCAWPAEARYKGAGSTDDAANFECRAPAK